MIKYYDWISYNANYRPNKTALHCLSSGKKYTYLELNVLTASFACWMQKNNIQKGDRVAILAKNCPEFFIIQFACAKIGAILVPLNWRLTEPELTYILKDCKPNLLIVDSCFFDVGSALVNKLEIHSLLEIGDSNDKGTFSQVIKNRDQTFKEILITLDDIIFIMYTSGTTGHPKGAIITHKMQFFNFVNLSGIARLTEKTIQLTVLPLFHTAGVNLYANPTLHQGGTLILMKEFEPGEALDAINNKKLGITHIFAVPAPFQFMMQHPKFSKTDFSTLENAGVGGAPCPEVIIKAWQSKGIEFLQGWGMTETSPAAIFLSPSDALRKAGSAGKELLHTEIRIVDKDEKDVKGTEVGELWVRGPNVTPGYWMNADATKKAFKNGWLKTRDAAKYDEEGFVYIVDRHTDMYISGGENVYPAEVENVIYQLEEVAEAGIIGVPDNRWGETGKAFIVLKPNKNLSEDKIISHCAKNLAKYKIPSSIQFIDSLPRNATGKILKFELRKI